MPVNGGMHPRNPFRAPIDFNRLAAQSTEFRTHCRLGTNGKVKFSFNDDGAVRALTRALLKLHFQLDVVIPPGHLCPRVPQRLNYLLWIEDRLRASKINADDVVGIDVGTGSSCIFALLGARQMGWRFIGTEVDREAVDAARDNIRRNDLEGRIDIREVPNNGAVIKDVISLEGATFCMCNPPFFEDMETSERFVESSGAWRNRRCDDKEGEREEARPPPASATVARGTELATEGGEVAFVSRLIDEGRELGERVKLYTTMLGKQSSVRPLQRKLEEMKKSDDRLRMAVSTLEQGRTTRWLIAWTFSPLIILPQEQAELSFQLPPSIGDPEAWMRSELSLLGVSVAISDDNVPSMCTATERRWLRKQRKRKIVVPADESSAEVLPEAILRFSFSMAATGSRVTLLLQEGSKQDLNHLVQFLSNRASSFRTLAV